MRITEQSYTYAFPKTGTHGECLPCRDKANAISAIRELMAILPAVVSNAKPKLPERTRLNDLPLPMCLYKDALAAKANASK